MRKFKSLIEDNHAVLKQCTRNQSSQLINQLIQGLRADGAICEDKNKHELLQQLLSVLSQNQNQIVCNINV